MELKKELYIAEEEQSGDRLDVFLAQESGKSRSFFQKLIRDSHVKVNGQVVQKAGFVLKKGDVIKAEYPEPVEISLKPENIPLEFVYQRCV